jgi:hypothetical protein
MSFRANAFNFVQDALNEIVHPPAQQPPPPPGFQGQGYPPPPPNTRPPIYDMHRGRLGFSRLLKESVGEITRQVKQQVQRFDEQYYNQGDHMAQRPARPMPFSYGHQNPQTGYIVGRPHPASSLIEWRTEAQKQQVPQQTSDANLSGHLTQRCNQMRTSPPGQNRSALIASIIHDELPRLKAEQDYVTWIRQTHSQPMEYAGYSPLLAHELHTHNYHDRAERLAGMRHQTVVDLISTINRDGNPADNAAIMNALINEGALTERMATPLLKQLPSMSTYDMEFIANALSTDASRNAGQAVTGSNYSEPRGTMLLNVLKDPNVPSAVKGTLVSALAPSCDFQDKHSLTQACAVAGLPSTVLRPLLSAISTQQTGNNRHERSVNFDALLASCRPLQWSGNTDMLNALVEAWRPHFHNFDLDTNLMLELSKPAAPPQRW